MGRVNVISAGSDPRSHTVTHPHTHTHTHTERRRQRSEPSSGTADNMSTDYRIRFFMCLQGVLLGGFVDSSVLPPPSVVTRVGAEAVLPCSWRSRLGDSAPSVCHVQWTTPADSTVFEQQGAHSWQAEEFVGRVEVPQDRLGSGDCSLIIRDVQIADTGSYESFMVVDGVKSTKTRVFIQSVKLSVSDHKSQQSRGPGEDLVLDLHTRHSMRVIFQSRNSSQWVDVWMRGDNDTQRVQKHPTSERLTIRRLTGSDQGLYKVLDEYGLAVSSVQLSVQETSPERNAASWEALTDDAARGSSSARLGSALLLLTSLQILHLL